MKNKKLTYVLLPLVAIIWGTIFWKIFSGTGGNVAIPVNTPSSSTTSKDVSLDSIPSLKLDYADPFLKMNYQVKKEDEGDKKEVRKPIRRVVRWPRIEYRGSVSSDTQKGSLGMLVVNNKELLVRAMDVKEGVKIIKITPDSIGLEYQEDKRFFLLKGFSSNH